MIIAIAGRAFGGLGTAAAADRLLRARVALPGGVRAVARRRHAGQARDGPARGDGQGLPVTPAASLHPQPAARGRLPALRLRRRPSPPCCCAATSSGWATSPPARWWSMRESVQPARRRCRWPSRARRRARCRRREQAAIVSLGRPRDAAHARALRRTGHARRSRCCGGPRHRRQRLAAPARRGAVAAGPTPRRRAAMTPLQFEAALARRCGARSRWTADGRSVAETPGRKLDGAARSPRSTAALRAPGAGPGARLPGAPDERLEALTQRAHQLIYRRHDSAWRGWRGWCWSTSRKPCARTACYLLVATLLFALPLLVVGCGDLARPGLHPAPARRRDGAAVRAMYGDGARRARPRSATPTPTGRCSATTS